MTTAPQGILPYQSIEALIASGAVTADEPFTPPVPFESLALGVVPVATTEWFGKHPGAIFPWAKDKLGSAKVPTVLEDTDGVQLEKVAAQQPDLILGVYSGITKKEYDALSKIAPVVAQPKGKPDFGTSWQEETLISGQVLGRWNCARCDPARATAVRVPGARRR